jgi:hypothetical protein
MEKVKPWGLLGVIVLLFYARPIKDAFFAVVNTVYRAFGGTDLMNAFGYELFRWWTKNPL